MALSPISNPNRTAIIVAIATAVIVGVFVVLGLRNNSKYDAIKQDYENTQSQINQIYRLQVKPTAQAVENKELELNELEQKTKEMRNDFSHYFPDENSYKQVTPQEFANRLKAINQEISQDFKQANITTPDNFFLGFEGYKDSLAKSSCTCVLGYELESVRAIFKHLSESRAEELKNFYREILPAEKNSEVVSNAAKEYESLPVEIAFTGKEQAARAFFNALLSDKKYYFVVRSLSIRNNSQKAPLLKAQSNKVEKPKPEIHEGENKAASKEEASPEDKPTIKQILGNEKIMVVARIDIILFLPAAKNKE